MARRAPWMFSPALEDGRVPCGGSIWTLDERIGSEVVAGDHR